LIIAGATGNSAAVRFERGGEAPIDATLAAFGIQLGEQPIDFSRYETI
jgi:hypothetical protein